MDKKTIPEIRARLFEIADLVANDLAQPAAVIAEEIRQLAYQTIRRPPTRKPARVKHPPLTEKEKLAIRKMAWENPALHLDDIAKAFNVNPGRISEALRGE